jgi:hypothetical protein
MVVSAWSTPQAIFRSTVSGLVAGANTITATITSQGGQSSSQTINITSSGKSPFVVTVDPDEGFAP